MSGYSFTLCAVRRASLDFQTAIKVAIAADTVSIAVMELIANAIIRPHTRRVGRSPFRRAVLVGLPGRLRGAFLITTPVNEWMTGRGKGHAVVHAYR
ncbi:DUF4396 domain-containing protein [Streptomyces capitiformicae]|uniref:DUF4396 domain-containing protein n=1 Tax=Streptomyces capitiformicae TaxID=2014920 RepID=A0A919GJA6_9ACTN|nr:DUF4396 domain-containing protein [Streptomyces capitiformicae]GHH85502.1 hypothetical protein GCM10017771_18620 [Streptomyces capitiformicae]